MPYRKIVNEGLAPVLFAGAVHLRNFMLYYYAFKCIIINRRQRYLAVFHCFYFGARGDVNGY